MSDSQHPDAPEIIDADRLVSDLEMRAERQLHERSESVSAAGQPGTDFGPASSGQAQLAHPSQARLELRPELYTSNRRMIGPLIARVRWLLLKLLIQPLNAWFTEEATMRENALRAEAAARERDEASIRTLEEMIRAEFETAERVAALETLVDQLELSQRIAANETRQRFDGVERQITERADRVDLLRAKLDHLQLPVRLSRLERQLPETTMTVAGKTRRQETRGSARSIDYLTFEARFRPEETVRERQTIYVDLLKGCRRVADLGCGRGELLDLLSDAGVSAYGVDIERDFIAIAREKGLEVIEEDAVLHVEHLDPGAVDAITASHLVEHLPTEALIRLIAAAAERLDEGGMLILETPNPESLLAGSVNFPRDPTHRRPIHPDTLEFLCESAGFTEVKIERLAPTPESELLPRPALTTSPLAAHVDAVINRLNRLLYGYQDYAVFAWK